MNLSLARLAMTSAFFILGACGTESANGSGGGSSTTSSATVGSTASSTQTGSGGSTPACVEDDLVELGPFGGPGFDASKGGLVGTPLDSDVVATTVLTERPEAQAKFFQLSTAAIGRANQSDGFIGFSVGTSKKCGTARTITVWKSPEAMMTFVASPEHAACMAASSEVSVTGSFTMGTATAAEVPPSFETARAKLVGVAPAY